MTVSGSGSLSGAGTLTKTTVGVATLVTSGIPNPGTLTTSAFSFTAIFLNAQGVQDATAVFTAGTSSVPGVATVAVVDHSDGTATVNCTFVGIGATFIGISATSAVPATAALTYRLGTSALWATQGHQNFTLTAVNTGTNTLSVAGDQTHFFPVGTHPVDNTTIANYTVASVVYSSGPNTTAVTMQGGYTFGSVGDDLHSSVNGLNYTIQAVNTGTNTFTVNQNRTSQFPMNSTPSVRSTITYKVNSAAFDGTNTNVVMNGSYVGGLVGDNLKADNFAYDTASRVWIPSPPPPLDPPLSKPPGAFDVVLDYGADPTGVLDSGPAFANAIDAAQAVAGSVVWLPDGEYSIDTVLPNTNQTGVQIPSKTNSAAITVAGTGRDKVFIRQRAAMSHLVTDVSSGVTMRDFTVDTATSPMSVYDANGLNATGVASNGSGCTQKGLGSLGGTTYCWRFVGTSDVAHATGNSADDIYIDSGSQLLNNSGDIDFQTNWMGTRFNFWGGMINPFHFSGLDWRHITYHNNGRDNSGGQLIALTNAQAGTITLQDVQDYGGTGSVALKCPISSASFQSTATIVIDGYVQHNSAGKFVIGDVVSPGSIDVKNSTFWNVELQPFVDVVGTWEGSNFIHGGATCNPQQAGAHSHLTGYPNNCP